MHPAISQKGSINSEGQVSEGSAQSESDEPMWTYSEELCAVFHDDGCKICKDWMKHYNDNSISFEQARRLFRSARYRAFESELIRLEQEEDAALQEINALNRELQEIQAETERIRQDQQSIEDALKQLQLQVEGKIREAIDQLRDEIIIEYARGTPSEPISPRPHKRLRLDLRKTPIPFPGQSRPTMPPQAVEHAQEIIYID
jgi:hypothetical protein